MIGILLHRTSGDRQLVHAARTDCGSCLTPQDNLLRELLVIRPVLVRTVIESGYIHYGSHIIIHHCVRSIHALSDGAGGIFAVTDVLQEAGQLRSAVTVPLVGNLVADAPHNDRRVVAVVANEVGEIFVGPFVEQQVVAVFAFWFAPFVEALGHQHHAHFIAGFD